MNKLKNRLIGAIDQGTTSTRFMIFRSNDLSKPLASHQIKHKTYTPKPGWVEQDAIEIIKNTETCMVEAVKKLPKEYKTEKLAGIGITNQRETTVVWDARTGEPLAKAIVWNDTRTQKEIKDDFSTNQKTIIKDICGLPISTYFSGLKLRWLIRNNERVVEAMETDACMFGTMDSWLIWSLTGGKDNGVHVTDVTNASRTMLMNIKTRKWDETCFELFDIPYQTSKIKFPDICSSAEIYGNIHAEFSEDYLKGVPISGCAGDQQSALIGQQCFKEGQAKNTYGTGCFLLMNTGEEPCFSKHGLLTTVAYQFGKDNTVVYALEGSVANAGSAIDWAKEKLGLYNDIGEIEHIVTSVEDSGDVYFVPAFSGLFAPHWDVTARGTITGLTLHSTKAHILRALLEGITAQCEETLSAMAKDANIVLDSLKVDGGITQNAFMMQTQSNLSNVPVQVPSFSELTIVGAVIAAGLGSNVWTSIDDIPASCEYKEYLPNSNFDSENFFKGWKSAIHKSKDSTF